MGTNDDKLQPLAMEFFEAHTQQCKSGKWIMQCLDAILAVTNSYIKVKTVIAEKDSLLSELSNDR